MKTAVRLLEVHLESADLDRSISFYSTLFPEARVTHWDDRSAAALVFDSGTTLGLWQKGKVGLKGGRAGEHVHFAVQIELAEIDMYRARLTKLDCEVIEHNWKPPHKSLYFFDPDGHQGELMTTDWIDFLENN